MNSDPAAWSCSFCGKRGTDDTRFAGGLGALMCTDCLEKYTALFAAPENAGQKIVGWGDAGMTDSDMLARLPLVSATDAQVDRYLRAWVAQIRLRNVSYAEIGKALGVSRQAAWERFSRVVEPEQQSDGMAAQDASSPSEPRDGVQTLV